MAQTYSSTPVLSIITLPNGNSYYLKDADARAILDTLKSAAFLDADSSITDGATGVAKTQAIKAYVDSAIKIGVTVVKVDTLPTASASTEGKIYIVPQSQGKTDDNFDEYITIKGGTAAEPTYSWEKIGDTRIDLSGYVTNVSYVANTHKLQQTKNGSTTDVHTFGALADKSSASGSYTKPTGSGSVAVPSTYEFAGSSGSVSVTGSVSTYESVDASLMVYTEDDEFVKSVSATKDAVTGTVSGGSVTAGSDASFTAAKLNTGFYTAGSDALLSGGKATVIDTTKFSGGSLSTKNYGFASSQDVLATATVSGETLTFGKVTAGTQDALTPAAFQNGFYTAGSDAVLSGGKATVIDTSKFSGGSLSGGKATVVTLPTTATIAADTVVTAIDDSNKDYALTSAGLSDDDGSSTGTITVSVGVTTGESASVTSTGTFTPAGSVTTKTTTNATVTVGTESGTVTVS